MISKVQGTIMLENGSIYDPSSNTKINGSILLKNGIIVRDLIGFGLPDCIRVTIGTKQENELFIDKVKEYFN